MTKRLKVTFDKSSNKSICKVLGIFNAFSLTYMYMYISRLHKNVIARYSETCVYKPHYGPPNCGLYTQEVCICTINKHGKYITGDL